MAIITCTNAAFGYEGNTAIEGLDFSLESGAYLCVVGENGSGKSTLIKGLLHLKQPQKGVVALGDGLRADEIGYLPQQTAAQKDFPASVWEVVLSGRLNARGIRPFYSRHDKDEARRHIEALGLENLTNRCYRELSGGQQQRVLLARALCATKKLLLLDEPVAGLDPIVTQELYALIRGINRTSGITVVMVSHDVHAATGDASHILHLAGRQLFFGTTAAYLGTALGHHFMGGERHVADAV